MKDLATELTTGENTSFRDFEEYLQTMFMKDEPESVGTKDDFEDNFENWIHDLDAEEWLEYGDKFNRLNK